MLTKPSENSGKANMNMHLGRVAQAIIANVLFHLVRFLPFGVASAIGGWLGRCIGPSTGISKIAWKNLTLAFPEKSSAEVELIIRDMWDNLGRSLFEFPKLDQIKFEGRNARAEIINAQYIDTLRDDEMPGLFISGHLANWEVTALGLMSRGIPIHLIYRAPNNPLMGSLYARRNLGQGELLPKGTKGAKRAIQLLNSGEHLGILVDQKMNDGIAVPFFGREAMTAPAVAQFAYRYECPVVPLRMERISGARFRLTAFPPLVLPDTGDKQENIRKFMEDINAILEEWIRERPEHWLWVHRRWPD